MGNSPSQEARNEHLPEPDDFDLDEISNGSQYDDNDQPILPEKTQAESKQIYTEDTPGESEPTSSHPTADKSPLTDCESSTQQDDLLARILRGPSQVSVKPAIAYPSLDVVFEDLGNSGKPGDTARGKELAGGGALAGGAEEADLRQYPQSRRKTKSKKRKRESFTRVADIQGSDDGTGQVTTSTFVTFNRPGPELALVQPQDSRTGSSNPSSSDQDSIFDNPITPTPTPRAKNSPKMASSRTHNRHWSKVVDLQSIDPQRRTKKRRRETSPPTTMESVKGQSNSAKRSKRGNATHEEESVDLAMRSIAATQSQQRPSPKLPLTSDVPDVDFPRNMATSTARRTYARSPSRDDSIDHAQAPGSDGGSEYQDRTESETSVPWPSHKIRPTGLNRRLPSKTPQHRMPKAFSEVEASDEEPSVSVVVRAPKNQFRCRVCDVKFPRKAALQEHIEDPEAHPGARVCFTCHEDFPTEQTLKGHQQQSQHGLYSKVKKTPRPKTPQPKKLQTQTPRGGITGRFSEEEHRSLQRYRDRFCMIHTLNHAQFNDLMTQAIKQRSERDAGDSRVWESIDLSRVEFLEQYYEVLPERNRKSMARYRERNFQNLKGPDSKWEKEDDDLIIKLVAEMGKKWVYIGQQLTRTQDAVQQRWKNHLEHRDKFRKGDWTLEEVESLRQAIERARETGGLAKDGSEDKRIVWSQVSNDIDNARSSQQCSNKWEIIVGGKSKKRKSLAANPEKNWGSKVRRSAVAASESSKNKISAQYVDESDQKGSANEQTVANDAEPEIQETRLTNGLKVAAADNGGNDSDTEDQSFQSTAEIANIKNRPAGSPSLGSEELEDEDAEMPDLPPKSRSKRTSARAGILTQAFGNTQVNTSVLRDESSRRKFHVSDRPSPTLQTRLRYVSPEEEEENTGDGHEEVRRSANEEEEGDEDETEGDDIEKEVEEGQLSIDEETESEDDDEAVPTVFTKAQKPFDVDPDATSSEDESEKEEDGDDSTSSGSGSDDDEEEEEDSNDEMVQNAYGDWMANVTSQAKKGVQSSQSRGRTLLAARDDDSSSGSED